MTAVDEQRTPTQRHALAAHNHQLAKIEADSWAHIIAQDCLAALDDWSKLPTRSTLMRFKAAKADLVRASEVLAAASEQVSA